MNTTIKSLLTDQNELIRLKWDVDFIEDRALAFSPLVDLHVQRDWHILSSHE